MPTDVATGETMSLANEWRDEEGKFAPKGYIANPKTGLLEADDKLMADVRAEGRSEDAGGPEANRPADHRPSGRRPTRPRETDPCRWGTPR